MGVFMQASVIVHLVIPGSPIKTKSSNPNYNFQHFQKEFNSHNILRLLQPILSNKTCINKEENETMKKKNNQNKKKTYFFLNFLMKKSVLLSFLKKKTTDPVDATF